MIRARVAAWLLLLTMASMELVVAQGPPPGGGFGGRGPNHGQPQHMDQRPPDRNYPVESRGRWWTNPATVQKLGITTDQQKRIDGIFQGSRIRLIDLSASLQKEEVTLEPLLAADKPDEVKGGAQIDRVAQARAELEKANARMLLSIRSVLTADQWKKLQADSEPGSGRRGPQHPNDE